MILWLFKVIAKNPEKEFILKKLSCLNALSSQVYYGFLITCNKVAKINKKPNYGLPNGIDFSQNTSICALTCKCSNNKSLI